MNHKPPVVSCVRIAALSAAMVLAVHGLAATPPPVGPQVKLLVSSESGLDLPEHLSLPPAEAINNAGDYAFIAGGSALFLRRAGDVASSRLLQMGDQVPGVPHSRVEMFGSLRINEVGVVCVQFDYFEGQATQNGIFTYDSGGFHKIALAAERPPGSELGTVFGRSMSVVALTASGDVVFTAPLIPLGSPQGTPSRTTIFVAPAGETPIRVAGPDDPAPVPGGGTFSQVAVFGNMNPSGKVFFTGTITGGTGGSGLFAWTAAGGIETLVLSGEPAPGTDGTFGQLSNVAYNTVDEVLFRADIAGGSGGFGNFVWSGGVVRKVMATGDPNLRGGSFDENQSVNLRLNNAGHVAFVARNALYFSAPGADLTLALRPGTHMPGPDYSLTLWSINSLAGFNDAGDVALGVALNGVPGTGPNAIVRCTEGSSTELIAYRGQAAPGAPGQAFNSFNSILLNSAGDVSFYSGFETPPDVSGGLFKKPGGGALAPVIVNGDAAPPSVGGKFVTTGSSRLFDDGSVYFESDLVDGPAWRGAFLATTTGVRVLVSSADGVPAGSRAVFRTLFLGGAGNYAMFNAWRSGGGYSLWVHNVLSGVTTRVVADGDLAPVPGGGQIMFSSQNNQYVNADGEAVFPAGVSGHTGTFLFSWTPADGHTKLVGPGDTAPGTDAVFTSCGFASLLTPPFSGDLVVFRGTLSDGSNGIFLVPRAGGAVVKVVLSTDPAPGGGTFTNGTNTTLNYPYVNAQGQVVFWGLTSLGTSGVFLGSEPGEAPVAIAVTNGSTAEGDIFSGFSSRSPAGFNDRGEVVFFGHLNDGASGGLFLATIAPDSPIEVRTIALNGAAAPLGGDWAFDTTSIDAEINDAGDIVFRAPLTGGTADSGLFLRRANTGLIETVALQGQAAPGTAGVFPTIPRSINSYPGERTALGPTGEVVFTETVDLGGTIASGVTFRYRGPGTLEKLLARAEPAPESGGGTIGYVSQGPGAGRPGLFFFGVRVIDGAIGDGIYSTVIPTLTAVAHNAAHAAVESAVVGEFVHPRMTVAGLDGDPTGTVTFTRYRGAACESAISTSAPVALTAGGIAEGPPALIVPEGLSFRGVYSGDASFPSATGACVPVAFARAPTSTVINLHNPNPSIVGHSVTVRVTVTNQPPAVGTPTGTVTVSDGVSSCSAALTPARTGVCRLELATVGVRTLTAHYEGDGNFLSSSVSVPHTVRTRGK